MVAIALIFVSWQPFIAPIGWIDFGGINMIRVWLCHESRDDAYDMTGYVISLGDTDPDRFEPV